MRTIATMAGKKVFFMFNPIPGDKKALTMNGTHDIVPWTYSPHRRASRCSARRLKVVLMNKERAERLVKPLAFLFQGQALTGQRSKPVVDRVPRLFAGFR